MLKKTKQNIEVLVIGGGASGMMAAGRAGELGKKVILIEKNSALGEKLKITGGGRCNITNAEYNTKKLLSHYGNAEKFLHSPFSKFGVKETFDFFESRGLPLIVQDRNRAFPKTQNATDVFLVLEKYIKKGNVQVYLNSPAIKIQHKNGHINEVETATHIFSPEKVIIATGGVSHQETGSTGDGFNWLKDLGHAVQAPTPDIVPLALKDKWPSEISGVALDNIKITFYCEQNGEKKKSFVEKGRMLCTHFGISGPMILNSASRVRDLLYDGTVIAKIDLFPDIEIGDLEKKFIELFDENKNKMLKNIIATILPAGFMPAFKKLFPKIDLETKVHSLRKEERKLIVQTLKGIEVTVSGLMGLDRAVVSDGGVVLNEIDTKTMRSLKIDNLFVTGDLLHISRPSGGYSLQLCWTTGFLAGSEV